jgi:ADP-heptose:LPS heptosyltransferase
MISVATMRRVDRWLGVPACAFLTLARRLGGAAAQSGAGVPAFKRLLFVKLAEQGSTVLASRAIRRAIRLVGAENVFFLVFEENRKILDAMALIPEANVITIRSGSIAATIRGALAAVRRMRAAGIDASVDLEFFARSSAVLSYLSGATWRSGFHPYSGEAAYRGDLLTHRVSFNPYLHTSQAFDLLVAALERSPAGFPAFDERLPLEDDPLPCFQPTAAEIDRVGALLRTFGGGDQMGGLILLNANASDLMPLRRWPVERYVDLARQLLARYPDVMIGFTGAPDEQTAIQDVVSLVASPRAVCFAGRTSIRELLTLYGFADVLVTNDSGPAHFAALTPVDVIALFGPETPQLFRALTPRSHPLWAGIGCSPCINAFNDRLSACSNNVCMQAISVSEVADRVCEIYDARRAARSGARSLRNRNA